MEKTLNLGWGDPYFLLELLDKIYSPKFATVGDLTYAPDAGMPELLEQVQRITEETTGNHYKHYLITNGATQAINIIMKVWERDREIHNVITSKLGYPYYPRMIDKTMTMDHIRADLGSLTRSDKDMVIVDSPSNPLGEQFSGHVSQSVIWDAVYHNPIYNATKIIKPAHEVYVGSLSKLLGITGARVGWIATNDKAQYSRFMSENLYDIATVSKPSQKLAIDILNTVNIDQFMSLGKVSLDSNRCIMQKLAPLLGTDVQEKGMFYCAQVDDKIMELFSKADIFFVQFENEGKKYMRLNLGQTYSTIYEAVQRINKADRRK